MFSWAIEYFFQMTVLAQSQPSLTVTASVFLSELVGQCNQNGSGGDEKMDAPQGLTLNLTTLNKKRVDCDLPLHLLLTLSCPFCLWSRNPEWGISLWRRGLINAIFVGTLLRWPEQLVTNRIENTPFLQIGFTERLCSYGLKRGIYRISDVTEV